MGAPNYSMGLTIGSDPVDDLAVIYFSYTTMWDRGSKMNLLISDPDGRYLDILNGITDDNPTVPVSFGLQQLESSSNQQPYRNAGTKRTMYVHRAAQVTTPEGICVRLVCVDLGYLALRAETNTFAASNVSADQFLIKYLSSMQLKASLPRTGDVAGIHRAVQARPISVLRYELDRVLSSGGKTISLQFDDSAGGQQLVGYEENDGLSDLLETYSGGTYVYGGAQGQSTFGNACYHFEMMQDFESVLWGHRISTSHMTNDLQLVTGTVVSNMGSQLGLKGKLTDHVKRRISIPRSTSDSSTSDDYYANAALRNAVYHARMSATSGVMVIDPDFKAFDGIDLLNRKHVQILMTGPTNANISHVLTAKKSVIMGYQHVFNRTDVKTKLYLRRGDA